MANTYPRELLSQQRRKDSRYNLDVIGPMGQSVGKTYGQSDVVPPEQPVVEPENPTITAMRQKSETMQNQGLVESEARRLDFEFRNKMERPKEPGAIGTKGGQFGTGFGGESVWNQPTEGNLLGGGDELIRAYHTDDQLAEFARANTQRTQGGTSRTRGGTRGEPLPGSGAYEKAALAEESKTLDIYKKQREILWAEEDRASQQTILQQNIGLGEANLARARIQTAKEAQDFADAELMRPVTQQKAIEELNKLKTENISSELKVEREKALNALITSTAPQLQPTTQTKDQIMSAQTPKDTMPTHNDLYSVAARYNIPDSVRDNRQLGIWIDTYSNPMELAKDADIKLTGDIAGVKQSDVSIYAKDIRDAMTAHLMPDQAIKKILKESGKVPADKDYEQTAMNITAGVWQAYKKDGDAALPEMQAYIAQSEAEQRNRAAIKIDPLTQQVVMPEVVKAILATKQETIGRTLAASKTLGAGGTGYEPFGTLLEKQAYGQAGLEQFAAEGMSPELIKTTVLSYLLNETQDPQAKAYLADQISTTSRDPALDPFLDALVIPFNKGYKAAKEEEVKKQTGRKAQEDTNAKNNLITKYDNEGKQVLFTNNEQGRKLAALYDSIPMVSARKVIEQNTQERVLKEIGDQKRRPEIVKEINTIRKELDKIWDDRHDPKNALSRTENRDEVKRRNMALISQLNPLLAELSKIDGTTVMPQKIEEPRVNAEKTAVMATQPTAQPTEVERKTSDGKIAIFDATTKQFIRYK
jgi:hypothetical protein